MIDLTECLIIDGRPDDPDSLTLHAARRFLDVPPAHYLRSAQC